MCDCDWVFLFVFVFFSVSGKVQTEFLGAHKREGNDNKTENSKRKFCGETKNMQANVR